MPNISQHRQLQRLPEAERHEASNFTLAVVMAGIFAFFIAGIASAFIYAKDTDPTQVQPRRAPRRPRAAPADNAPAPVSNTGGGK